MKVTDHQEGIRRLGEFVLSIRHGEPQAYKNLIIFPLYTDMVVSEDRYMLFSEAVKTGKFRVLEISEGGSVPELHVINELDKDVIILEGEILKGAKQDRTVNTTIIVGKSKKVNMNVSCVEQGRWSYKSREFEDTAYSVDSNLRKAKTRSVSENLGRFSEYVPNQGMIWDSINAKAMMMEFRSPSSCVTELYESRQKEYKEYGKGFSCSDTQAGIGVFVNGLLSGCDIFGVKGLMQRAFSKILSSYIYEGIERNQQGEKDNSVDYMALKTKLDSFFKDIAETPKEVYKSRGEGYDIRFDKGDITGFAIEHEGTIVQMTGFYLDDVEWGYKKGQGNNPDEILSDDRDYFNRYYYNEIRRMRRRQ